VGYQDPSVFGELLLIDGPVPAFDRVPEGHWAKRALDVLFARGLLDEGTALDPAAPVGKAEFASLLARALGLSDAESLFGDVREQADGSLNREGMMVMTDRALEAAGKGIAGQDALAGRFERPVRHDHHA